MRQYIILYETNIIRERERERERQSHNNIKKYLIYILFLFISFNANADQSTIRELGDLTRVIVPAYAAGFAAREDGWEGLKQLSLGVILSQTASEGLKKATNKERPDYEEGDAKESFPSGHVVGVFSGASFIRRRYGWEHSIVPYGLSIFTAYSRVKSKKHYIEDVVAGAALAEFINFLLTTEYKKDDNHLVSFDGKNLLYVYKF
ncbi:MAG: phosphatase PAP2 family protein [Rickettsiales bacterium]|jgi:membrane-associated phospholipid phosphatase|nr:phosphatase PAP2 family protein [Rickettsiales bacterium]